MKKKINLLVITGLVIVLFLSAGCQPATPKPQPTEVPSLPTQPAEMKAEVTEMPPEELVKTAMAMMPQSASGEIALTQMPQLLATKFPEPPLPQKGPNTAPGIPADIPIYKLNENLQASEAQISYVALMDYKTVLEFYKSEMVGQGWNRAGASAVEDENAASLIYQKPNREAAIELKREGEKTSVLIVIKNM